MSDIVEDKFRMDGHKLLWHLDRVAAWQKGERVAPLHIDMGISTGCNMGCTYCYGVIQGRSGFGTDIKGRFNLPTATVLQTFREAENAGVRSIALIGEGENTLHPDFSDIVAYGRDNDLDLSLATNGIRLDKQRADDLLTGLKWIRVNISAASNESFLKIHQVPQFDHVLNNIRALVALKKEKDYDCTLGLQMVVTHENTNDIVPLAKLGADLGVDYLVVKACSDTPEGALNAPTREYKDLESLFRTAEAYSREDYVVSIKWNKLWNEGYKEYPVCFGTQFIIAISGDGSVFPCGHWFDVRRDEFLMGNVIDTPLAEILKSERYWAVQKKIQTVNVNKDCETNCRQHYINQFLSPLRDDPTHKNFI